MLHDDKIINTKGGFKMQFLKRQENKINWKATSSTLLEEKRLVVDRRKELDSKTINAHEKMINKIEELLPNEKAISFQAYKNEEAIELFDRLPYFYNVKQLLENYQKQYAQYGIRSYTYANGLIKLKSYYVLNSEYAINQTIITDSLESNNEIIHIWNKCALKAVQQFFIDSESPSSLFGFPHSGNEDRGIETNDTEVTIENKVIGNFSRISKNNSATVYAEKYMPVNRLTYWELMPKDPFTSIELEVLYRYNDTPVFAVVKDNKGNSLFEGTSYHADDYESAEVLVHNANGEVEAILRKMTAVVSQYDKIESSECDKKNGHAMSLKIGNKR